MNKKLYMKLMVSIFCLIFSTTYTMNKDFEQWKSKIAKVSYALSKTGGQ